MQKLFCLFYGINITFLQNYYIRHFLTIGYGYPVPVDKHDSDKILPHLPDPLGGVKGQIFKFCNYSVSCQYFVTEILHADRGTISMKHIKRDFRTNALVQPLGRT